MVQTSGFGCRASRTPAIVPGPEAFNNQYLPVTTCLTTTSSPNYLYTLGGQEQWTYDMSKHVKAFSLTNGEWDCMRPLPAEAMGMWAGIIDDTLIAGGGRSSDFGPRVNDTVFCLDTTERNAFWKSLPTMPRGVSTAGAFVHNRKLFVIGGMGAPEDWAQPEDEDEDVSCEWVPMVQCFSQIVANCQHDARGGCIFDEAAFPRCLLPGWSLLVCSLGQFSDQLQPYR